MEENSSNLHKSFITMGILISLVIAVIVYLIFANVTVPTTQKTENYTNSLQTMLNEPLEDPPEALTEDTVEAQKTGAGIFTLYYVTNQRKILDTYLPALTKSLTNTNLNLNNFDTLTEAEQNNILTILETHITNLSWYDLSPYKTNKEKFDAYTKIHYLNTEAKNEPKMVIANAYGDQHNGISLTQTADTWEANYNDKHWTFNTVTQDLDTEKILNFTTIQDPKTLKWLIKLENIIEENKIN